MVKLVWLLYKEKQCGFVILDHFHNHYNIKMKIVEVGRAGLYQQQDHYSQHQIRIKKHLYKLKN